MPASTVTQNSGNLDSHPADFGHTTGTPPTDNVADVGATGRLAELLALRARIDAEIARERAVLRRVKALRVLSDAACLPPAGWEARVLTEVAAAFDVDVEQLRGRGRGAQLVAARHVACWVLRREGWSLTAIGELLGRDHTSVRYGIARVDELAALREVAGELHEAVRPAAHRPSGARGAAA